MGIDAVLLPIERKLWTNDAAFYHETLTEDAMLVFAETGAISRDIAVAAIREENAAGRSWPTSPSPISASSNWRPTRRC